MAIECVHVHARKKMLHFDVTVPEEQVVMWQALKDQPITNFTRTFKFYKQLQNTFKTFNRL